MTNLKALRCSLSLVLLAAVSAAASAGGPVVPFDIQVPLVLKALTYDRNLKGRAGEHVRIAVLSPKGSASTAAELQASLAALPDRTVNGMPVSFREIKGSDEAALDQGLSEGHWAAIYVMPGFDRDDLAKIRRVAESRHVLAVAAEAQDVERGMVFGVAAQGGKPQLVVNLTGAKACGSDCDLALIRLSRVIP